MASHISHVRRDTSLRNTQQRNLNTPVATFSDKLFNSNIEYIVAKSVFFKRFATRTARHFCALSLTVTHDVLCY